MSYTAYKVNMNGSLSNKEVLNNVDELNAWLVAVYGKFANVFVVQDQTGKSRHMTDNGEKLV